MGYLSLRTCSFLAFAASVMFAVLWISSATLDGEWTFGVDSLSRMGISENAVAAGLFNYGCMAAGAVGILIGIGMIVHEKGLCTIVGILYSVGLFFLMLVGVFPMDQGDIHYIVASTFAILVFFAVVVGAVNDFLHMWHPEIDAAIIAAMVVFVATQPFPMWEAVLTILALVWTALQGVKMRVHEDSFPLVNPFSRHR